MCMAFKKKQSTFPSAGRAHCAMHRVRAREYGLVRTCTDLYGLVRTMGTGLCGGCALRKFKSTWLAAAQRSEDGRRRGTVGWQSTPFLLAFPEKTDELKGFQGIKPAVERQFPGPGVVRRIPENIVPAPEKSSFFQKLYCTGTQIFF